MWRQIHRAGAALREGAARRRRRRELERRGVHVAPGTRLGRCTELGRGTRINGPAFIASFPEAPFVVGRYCAIGHELRVRCRNHATGQANPSLDFCRRYGFAPPVETRGAVRVGHGVWIGDRVLILPGVTIGDGAVIGGGSVVTRSIPAFTVAAGVPARPRRPRFDPSVVEQVEALAWWDWSEERIRRNRRFFEADLSAPGVDVAALVEP